MARKRRTPPADPADDHKRDWWDHVAYNAEHKLVLAVVPGARVGECAQEVVEEVKDRLGDRPPALFTITSARKLLTNRSYGVSYHLCSG